MVPLTENIPHLVFALVLLITQAHFAGFCKQRANIFDRARFTRSQEYVHDSQRALALWLRVSYIVQNLH